MEGAVSPTTAIELGDEHVTANDDDVRGETREDAHAVRRAAADGVDNEHADQARHGDAYCRDQDDHKHRRYDKCYGKGSH
ncbi:MAG: hypothetical protein PHS79_02870 [Patescibacteria group bacterium]|nr:hypothetical protein [Patescibacteria group bacterium]